MEDLILNVFFYDIEKGFYIDVGASDPNIISVTKNFYLKGWNGINIEPLEKEYNNLMKERPKDINLKMCAGEREGFIEIYEGGVGTTSKSEYKVSNKTRNVTLKMLANICKEFVPKDEIIHFCKIDVEGGEREVLLGYDFEKYRPYVFCIESTVPGTFTPSHKLFEDILIKNDYEFVYQYQINRFYIDKKNLELKERAKIIPKYINEFRRRSHKI